MKTLRVRFGILLVLLSTIAQPGSIYAQETEHGSATQQPVRSAAEIWADLMKGNQRFVAGTTQARESVALRKSLANSQHPKVVVLTCSDSRVSPELIFDKNLGDLFVVRSAGNVADAIGVGSIEYAVDHLGSRVLVILGHTQCGAVKAACSGEKMPTPNLDAIMDKIAPAVSQAKKSRAKDGTLLEAAIEENVRQSAKDVLATSQVLRQFVKEGKLTVLEAEYQLDTGEVVRLDAVPY